MAPLYYEILVSRTQNVAVVSVKMSRTACGHTWRWEVPLVLWAAMGTAATAIFVAEHYYVHYPEHAGRKALRMMACAIGTALATLVPTP